MRMFAHESDQEPMPVNAVLNNVARFNASRQAQRESTPSSTVEYNPTYTPLTTMSASQPTSQQAHQPQPTYYQQVSASQPHPTYYQQPPTAVSASQPQPTYYPTAVAAAQPAQPAQPAPAQQPAVVEQSKGKAKKPVVNRRKPAQWNYPTTKILVDLWVEKHGNLHGSSKNLYWESLKDRFHQQTGADHITKAQMERKVLLIIYIFTLFFEYPIYSFQAGPHPGTILARYCLTSMHTKMKKKTLKPPNIKFIL